MLNIDEYRMPLAGAQQLVTARALSEGWEATEHETNFCTVYKQFFPKEYCEVSWLRGGPSRGIPSGCVKITIEHGH